ncbi:MAG TPA: nucleotidyl transferase AbiEii/AbiGii toxin family protein [Chitinophagaceae bacterium]|nr:nucleotidyl transferase AbiEii/AbiGii toxin family protein [Chitinophagaceae bacterium]
MVEFLQLTEETRRTLIGQVNTKTGMSVQAIEKDWWVTLILKALFSLSMAEHFIFKGGTSLSKGWKLIDRFSDDIDIALAPEAFGREYQETPSISYVKRLKKEGCEFTSTVIRTALERKLKEIGIPEGIIQVEAEAVNPKIPDKDPQTIYVRFPSLYPASQYIDTAVKVEFGVRALKEPFTTVEIQSIIAAETSTRAYAEKPFQVIAVEPRKTFMEKLMLLHEKFLTGRAEGDAGERQSRHLSDLLQMRKKGIAEQVLGDPDLYALLLHHRKHYIKLKDIDYDSMQLRQLFFLPPRELLKEFRRDYEIMLDEMIYGSPPDFNTLINELRELNIELAAIGHKKNMKDVIERAKQQIAGAKAEEDVFQTIVVYGIEPHLPVGPDNIEIKFQTEFINSGDGIIFHRIRVV